MIAFTVYDLVYFHQLHHYLLCLAGLQSFPLVSTPVSSVPTLPFSTHEDRGPSQKQAYLSIPWRIVLLKLFKKILYLLTETLLLVVYKNALLNPSPKTLAFLVLLSLLLTDE